jgi:SAM-dependent methyltransferase
MINEEDLKILRCPYCGGELSLFKDSLRCEYCNRVFKMKGSLISFVESEAWRDYGSEHDLYRKSEPLPPNDFWIDFVRKVREFKKTDIVLDAGCGDMVWTANLANQVKQIYGIDLGTYMLNKASKRKLNNAILIEGSVENLPFKDETIDLIFNIYVFEHIPYNRSLKALNEFYRVLKPKGLLLIVTENPVGEYVYKRFLSKVIRRNFGTPDNTHINMLFPYQLRMLLRKINFDIISEWVPIIGENKFPLNIILKNRFLRRQMEIISNISYGFLAVKRGGSLNG